MPRSWLLPLLSACCLFFPHGASAQEDSLRSDSAVVDLPVPSGPNAVGTVTYRWTDAAREEFHTEDASDRREIVVQLWYPAEPDTKSPRAEYFPSLDVALASLRSEVAKGQMPPEMLGTFERFARVRTHSQEGARFIRGGRKYPVLVFSPGGNVSRHSYTMLMEEAASRGYVIASISHKYSVVDVFPEGLVASHSRWAGSGKLETREAKDKFWEPLAELQAGDVSFVLSELEKLNTSDPDGRLTGRIELRKVGIIGHSRGVKTVVTALANDARLKVGILYDNQPPMNKMKADKRQPIAMIRPDTWPSASDSTLRAFLKSRRAVGYDVTIHGAGHLNFSDFPIVSPQTAKYDIDPRRAYRIIHDCTFSMLDKYLDGRKAPLLDGKSMYPEMAITSFKPSP